MDDCVSGRLIGLAFAGSRLRGGDAPLRGAREPFSSWTGSNLFKDLHSAAFGITHLLGWRVLWRGVMRTRLVSAGAGPGL